MLTCREVSYLISVSLDQRLPLTRRLAMRLHFLLCRACARYRRQIIALNRLAKGYAQSENDENAECALSEEEKEMIKARLRNSEEKN